MLSCLKSLILLKINCFLFCVCFSAVSVLLYRMRGTIPPSTLYDLEHKKQHYSSDHIAFFFTQFPACCRQRRTAGYHGRRLEPQLRIMTLARWSPRMPSSSGWPDEDRRGRAWNCSKATGFSTALEKRYMFHSLYCCIWVSGQLLGFQTQNLSVVTKLQRS